MFWRAWWRHQMETFSALLAICKGNPSVTDGFPHKGQWRGALMFSFIYAWTNGWANNRDAGDLRPSRAFYDITVMRNHVETLCSNCELNNVSEIGAVRISNVQATRYGPLRWYLIKLMQIHYDDVIMSTIASQITSLTIVYLTIYSGADQSKHQSSASMAFVWGIHRGPVNSPHKWPVTRKMFPFDDVIMNIGRLYHPDRLRSMALILLIGINNTWLISSNLCLGINVHI